MEGRSCARRSSWPGTKTLVMERHQNDYQSKIFSATTDATAHPRLQHIDPQFLQVAVLGIQPLEPGVQAARYETSNTHEQGHLRNGRKPTPKKSRKLHSAPAGVFRLTIRRRSRRCGRRGPWGACR